MLEPEKEQLTELHLPSGLRITARRPGPLLLGSLGMALEVLKATRGETAADGMTDPQAADIAWAMGEALKYCLVKPSLSFDPKSPDEVHPRDIAFADAVYMVRWVLRSEQKTGPPRRPELPYVRRKCGGRKNHRRS